MAMRSSSVQREEDLEILYEGEKTESVKRNPYLVDFESQINRRQGGTAQQRHPGQKRYSTVQSARKRPEQRGYSQNPRPREQFGRNIQYGKQSDQAVRNQVRRIQGKPGWEDEELELDLAPRRHISRSAALARRRKRVLLQRMMVGVWVLCILVLAAAILSRNGRASAGEDAGNGAAGAGNMEDGRAAPQYSGYMTQGIPVEEFAKHPEWTEDFLTKNEYSRPGDPLESVKNIFVHYTANPGTSAAQNRSYFEWLKDTHETSASAHFIIGYEGEIIQCIPLDEIAYAVQSRNGDSISIECCYLEADGSFTQETYDSLLSLLAWLKNTYNLETNDILRHYDCGGKKCPLYYTDHPDAWEELKKDVDKL